MKRRAKRQSELRRIKTRRRINLAHMVRVKALGCWCCKVEGMGFQAAEAHHIRQGYGTGQKAHDDETIPLCTWHHREQKPGFLAVHRHKCDWVARYGEEREVLAAVLVALAESAA